MKVVAICATHGRHTCLERSVRMFLDQDYEDKHLLIFQNSNVPQKLDASVSSNVQLVNQSQRLDDKPFKSLGDIYDQCFFHVKNLNDADLLCFWDDDDLFLPYHISEGVKGYLNGRFATDTYCKAYKPKYSYYRSSEGVILTENTLEPSIFVEAGHVYKYGFSNTTTEQHLQWVSPLRENNELFIDPKGVPTLIYNWGDTHIDTYKTSGDFHNPQNFNNCRRASQDHGDGIITPISREEIQKYYDLVEPQNKPV